MNDLKRWATELYKCNEKSVELCGCLTSKEMEKGKYYGVPYLRHDADWRQVWEFEKALEKLIQTSGIQDLLARIMEGERE